LPGNAAKEGKGPLPVPEPPDGKKDDAYILTFYFRSRKRCHSTRMVTWLITAQAAHSMPVPVVTYSCATARDLHTIPHLKHGEVLLVVVSGKELLESVQMYRILAFAVHYKESRGKHREWPKYYRIKALRSVYP